MSEFCTICGISPVLGNGHKSLDMTFFRKGLILNVPNVWLSWFRILISPQWTQYFKVSMPKIRAGVLKWERQLLSLVVGGIPMSGGLHASTRSNYYQWKGPGERWKVILWTFLSELVAALVLAFECWFFSTGRRLNDLWKHQRLSARICEPCKKWSYCTVGSIWYIAELWVPSCMCCCRLEVLWITLCF